MDSIAALLNRLALHCPVRNLPETQAALLMQDTIMDLMPYDPQQIADACNSWRRGDCPFFPTSGQLIALIPAPKYLTSWDRPAFRAPKMLEGPPTQHKPWRQILAEKRLSLPPTPDELPPAPAIQEQLDEAGELTPERRAQLCGLRETLIHKSGKTS